MKRIAFWALFIGCITQVNAQKSDVSKQKVKSHFYSIDASRIALSDARTYRWQMNYEWVQNHSSSFLIGFEKGQYEYGTLSINGWISEEYSLNGCALLIEGRYFPFQARRKAPGGLFAGAFYRQYWINEQNRSNRIAADFERLHALSVFGLSAGYKFQFGHFFAEPVTGIGFARPTELGKDQRIYEGFGNYSAVDYSFRMALNVGLCF